MSSNILFEKDCNVQQPSSKADDKPKTMEYHRQVLESRLKDETNQQTYISPSDTIQSPATQKLAAFKNRHLGRGAVKPQSLFAKTTSRNADAAASSNMFADMPKAKSDAEGHQSGP